MTMTEILEQNKEKLIRQLETAATPDQARPVLEAALDRMLYRYNELCAEDRTREAAAGMMRAVRTAVPLVNVIRDVRVWERTVSGGERKSGRLASRIPFLLLLTAGAAFAAALLLTQAASLFRIPACLILLSASALCFFLSGRFSRGGQGGASRERMTECIVDGEGIYRTIHSVMLVMDQNLDQVSADAAQDRASDNRVRASSLTDAELSLYAGLLEASYSGDSGYAFEKLSELKYYLHTRNIDVIDYSEEHSAWFDRMPSMTEGTLRPALASEGRLLRKGLASA